MLAILSTHPIQYQVPIWKRLSRNRRVDFKVFYLSRQGLLDRKDPGFGETFAWDIDLLDGYPHEFLDVKEGSRQDAFFWLRLKEDFGNRLKKEGATALWVQGWQVAAYWQAVWQAEKHGVKLWLRAETNLRSTGRSRLRSIVRPLRQAYLRKFDSFLYIGEANRQFYLSEGVSDEKLVFAPYCVDNERFADQAAAASHRVKEIRRKWGIPEDSFCCLFVGKFIEKKRPIDLVRAAQITQQRAPKRPVHLLFVGSGELGAEIRGATNVSFDAQAFASGLDKRQTTNPSASFTGFLNQSEISEAYAASNCLVLPSEGNETWGLVANEAMASGLPVVLSNVCGCADDLVLPERSDLIFPVGNTAALASAIEACIAQPPSRKAIETTISRFDLTHTVEAVEKLYAIVGSAP
jgi:glycosyltransferase involved in cell wall biosynthesis